MQRAIVLCVALCAGLGAQTTARQVTQALEPALMTPDLAAQQLREYLAARAPALTRDLRGVREHLLNEVIFHGWPRTWVDAPPKFEDLGPIPCGPGYRMSKLRYEIVPGFYSTAILYQPEKIAGRVPAVLHVNGHVGAPGKAVEYKQKRCIHLARNGVVSLNLEWLGHGELSQSENQHWYAAHMDLAGTSGVGLFYLAMRKGLDYLWGHPGVDRARIGLTGLSGGGWQTITLFALDQRIAVAIPVAGYSAFISRVERQDDVGDVEQNPTDFYAIADYPHLTALRAPRPTLLVYNAEDHCCFRAPLVKPWIYDAVRSFFGKEELFGWHENVDPGTHNYDLDNRRVAYRFFARHFRIPIPMEEARADVKSFEELRIGVPDGNLTILELARKLSPRPAGPLREVVRYRPVEVRRPWAVYNLKSKGLASQSYVVQFNDGLSAAAVRLSAIDARALPDATILLGDGGRKALGEAASDAINRGEEVLAADLLLTGDAAPRGPQLFTQLLSGVGMRPLGIEAAHLIALARWFGAGRTVKLETTGPRMQVVAAVATRLEPALFGAHTAHNGLKSLRELLYKPIKYSSAPDLFCRGLLGSLELERHGKRP